MIKNVAIIGLGAVGALVYPEFVRVLGHEHVRVIAEGARAKRILEKGIMINGNQFYPSVVSPNSSDYKADLIIVAVKASGLESATKDIKHFVGDHTLIMSLLNGIDSEPKLIESYGEDHVIYSLTTINTAHFNGEINFKFEVGEIKFGDAKNIGENLSEGVLKVKALFDQTIVPYTIPANMIHELWKKFLFNASANSVAAVLHARHRYFQKIPSAVAAKALVIDEIMTVANAIGAEITEADATFYKTLPWEWQPEGRCSMVQDIEYGKTTENEMFLGTILTMAKENHIKIPACELLYLLIKTIDGANENAWQEHQIQ